MRALDDPHLTDVLPENDPHLIKARLLANAALNEYIRPEIQLSPTSVQWGALAEAQIYQSFGEDTRALQAMKRAKIPFFSRNVSTDHCSVHGCESVKRSPAAHRHPGLCL